MSSGVKPVVVGVDESPASRGAVWWAVREARLRGTALVVAHSASEAHPDRAAVVADHALRLARGLAPDLSVDAVVDERAAGPALCRLSGDAALVVVASRGLGGFAGLLLGSVSSHVATHAECPVLVVHHGERWAGPEAPDRSGLPVVVGAGPYGTPGPVLEPVLDFAFTEARLRAVPLVVLRTWRPPPSPWHSDVRPLVADVAELETSESVDLAETLKPWRHGHPEVAVRQRLVSGGAAAALVDAGAGAQLVVVGARRTRAAALRLGSVSQQVLHHAPCPVAVVHPQWTATMDGHA
jgi:nucleotide-binding universal stress UspA family protein